MDKVSKVSQESARLLKNLLHSPSFREAIEQLIAQELGEMIPQLRSLVRSRSITEAAGVEGAISYVEELPRTLERYAARAE